MCRRGEPAVPAAAAGASETAVGAVAVHPVGCATKEMNRGRDEGGELYLFSSVLAAVAAFRIASVAVLTFCGIILAGKVDGTRDEELYLAACVCG